MCTFYNRENAKIALNFRLNQDNWLLSEVEVERSRSIGLEDVQDISVLLSMKNRDIGMKFKK